MTDATSALRDPGLTPPSSPGVQPAVRGGRRRRPSGEAPPLPHELGQSGRQMLYLTGAVLATWILVLFTPLGTAFDFVDYWIIDRIVSIRGVPATRVFRHLDKLGSQDAIFILRWTVILGALIFRRFRHLVVFVATVLVTTWIAAGIAAAVHADAAARRGDPRPVDRFLAPVASADRSRGCAHRHHLRARAAGAVAQHGEVGGGHLHGDPGCGAALSDGRTPERRRVRAHHRCHVRSRGVPSLRSYRDLPGRVREPQQGCAPRRRWHARRRDQACAARTTRPRRRRGEAVRSRRVLRVDTAAHHARRSRRPGALRQAVREEPPPRRPFVQVVAHAALRAAGRRIHVLQRAPARAVRGLPPAPDVRRRYPDGTRRTGSSRSHRNASTCS